MRWKKFKKERISLNYTVMLLPHSQKKPIHFKTPVWTFGLFFLGILVLSGACLFFAGSRLQLKQVREEKAQLEQERNELASEKQLADIENEMLKQARETQEQELKDLEQKTRDTLKELEDLVERESQIRQELGLNQVGESGGQDGESEGAESNRNRDFAMMKGQYLWEFCLARSTRCSKLPHRTRNIVLGLPMIGISAIFITGSGWMICGADT